MTSLLFALALPLLAGGPDPLARAESLLVAGELADARHTLERYLGEHRDDPRALVLLGRVHLAWPVVGRFKAWELFERAARHAPNDPEPRYWQARVGLFLGSADGESIARGAIYRIWELQPSYRNTWGIWTQLHKSDRHRRRAARLLARHAGHALADLRRAQLLIELDRWPEADSVLAGLVRRGHDDAWVWALRAQGALETGDVEAGLAHYTMALERAATDTSDALWHQIAAIASPEEDSTYRATAIAERAGFFRAFWSRREPDLTTEPNERIAEHFARLRHVRGRYSLRHPLSSFHRSPLRRALAGALAGHVAREVASSGFPAALLHARLPDSIWSLGHGVDVRHLPEADSITRYRRFGLDGRGLLYLRYGEPEQVYQSGGRTLGDVETWRYVIDGKPVIIPFARATAADEFGFAGDLVIYPTNQRELVNSVAMLARDATAVKAERDMHVWVASFRDARRDRALVYVQGSADTVAAAVWDARWRERDRRAGAGPHTFSLPAGRYHVGVDARDGTGLARIRGAFAVPDLWGERLSISSILVSTGAEPPARDAAARAMPADLLFPVAAPLALYAEIYNLPATREGIAEFDVEYRFEPTDGGRAVTFSFARRARATPAVVEQIVLEPDRVPPGSYRIVLSVRDRLFGVEAQSTRVAIRLR